MLKIKKLQKQRTARMAELKQLRAKRKKLRADEAALDAEIDALGENEDISPEMETQIDELSTQLEEVNDAIAAAQDAIDELDAAIEEAEAGVADVVDEAIDEAEDGERSARRARPAGSRAQRSRSAAGSRNFRCRSRCFSSRAQRDEFYAQTPVKDFLARVRAFGAGGSRRSVTGAELGIPEEMLDVIRDNLDLYSKLITRVRLRNVRGKARQLIIGDVPEGVWMEMAASLNELTFTINEIEVDGYKVGGYIPIDNFLLKDSDINLGEEILFMLAQAIGYATDKGIVYGFGPTSKMPVGIVTRLAETAQPSYWGAKRGPWTDLHTSHIIKLNIGSESGVNFFIPFLQALKKARPRINRNAERIWIMNSETADDVRIRSLAVDSAAALMAGMNNTMPVIGGEIVTLEFIPDNEIVGGYGDAYLLVEREGAELSQSEHAMFIEDKTVFKGTARYDGQPIFGESFVLVNYANTNPTTEMTFATDYAGNGLNSLIVTAAAGSTNGKTVLTVSGAVSNSNDLYAVANGAPVSIEAGGTIKTSDWTKITSGSTQVTAAAGVGITVVELDGDGRVVSLGYVASVPKTS